MDFQIDLDHILTLAIPTSKDIFYVMNIITLHKFIKHFVKYDVLW